jgi:hypothetical protein
VNSTDFGGHRPPLQQVKLNHYLTPGFTPACAEPQRPGQG